MIEKFIFKALLWSIALLVVNGMIMSSSLSKLGKEGAKRPQLMRRIVIVGLLLGVLGGIIPLLLSLELIIFLMNIFNISTKLKLTIITIYTVVYLVVFLVKLFKYKKKDVKE